MTDVVWPEATRLLAEDPAFGPVVREAGPIRMRPPAGDAFYSLARSIVFQQLAGKAAAAIHGRFVDAVGGTVTPEAVLGADGASLRDGGLSAAKLRAIRDLAERVASGTLVLDDLEEARDEEVEERLVQVWGIGRWTAQMFLLFQLRRPDVWPVGDLGVRNGWARVHGLEEAPGAGELEDRGDPYRPWRSALAWYCWRAVDVTAPGE